MCTRAPWLLRLLRLLGAGALDTLASTQVHSNSALGRLQTQQAVQPLK